jgi:hypothetical protein
MVWVIVVVVVDTTITREGVVNVSVVPDKVVVPVVPGKEMVSVVPGNIIVLAGSVMVSGAGHVKTAVSVTTEVIVFVAVAVKGAGHDNVEVGTV